MVAGDGAVGHHGVGGDDLGVAQVAGGGGGVEDVVGAPGVLQQQADEAALLVPGDAGLDAQDLLLQRGARAALAPDAVVDVRHDGSCSKGTIFGTQKRRYFFPICTYNIRSAAGRTALRCCRGRCRRRGRTLKSKVVLNEVSNKRQQHYLPR